MTTFPMKSVYLNGRYLAPEAAQVSAFDRGFVFADGVYEVIPVYGDRPFRLPHHLQRLDASLAAIQIANPMGTAQWREVFTRLIADNGGGDQSIYLQVTRGPAPRDHAFPRQVTPTVFAYSQPLSYPSAELLASGVPAITVGDIRWARCDIKSIALLANIMLRQEAAERGAAEAILIREGMVTEGSASNIFVVRDGRLRTPPKGPLLLPGITRDLVLELAAAQGIPAVEATILESELPHVDELWLTSSTREILPITQLNGRPVGNGRPGALHARLHALYQDYKQAVRAGRAE